MEASRRNEHGGSIQALSVFTENVKRHLRRVKLTKLDGRCWKQGKKFHIQIDRSLDESRAMDVLVHEWAHARAWNHRLDEAADDAAFNKLAHDAAWGVAFAEIYSLYEQKYTHAVL